MVLLALQDLAVQAVLQALQALLAQVVRLVQVVLHLKVQAVVL